MNGVFSGARNRRTRVVTATIAIGLGCVSFASIAALERLPASAFTSNLKDGLALPGAIIASIVCPGGIHGGTWSAAAWPYVVMWANILCYSGFWYAVLVYLRRRRDRVSAGSA